MTKLFEWEHEFEYDYVEDADILEIFFVRGAATNAVEIADDITLRFDKENGRAMSLIFNNYSYFVEPAQYGPRSFQLKIDRLPNATREMVTQIINRPPVNRFIRTLTFSRDRRAIPIATIESHQRLSV
jgi:hypothetical protein